MKILIRWKWKVGRAAKELLDYLNIQSYIEDDDSFKWNFNNYVLQFDKIVVSPWIKPNHQIYKFWKDKIIWELDLIRFLIRKFGFKNLYFIWITWTDGKSTTTWKIYNILKDRLSEYNVYIWGNFDKPISLLFLDWLKKKGPAVFVLEISSFMAYNLKRLKFIGSFWTNFEVDHLDWHKDLQDYRKAKQNLFKNTIGIKLPSVWLKVNYDFFKTKEKDLEQFLSNLLNIFWYKISKEEIRKKLSQIKPLPHRFQFLKQIWDIKIYDDWKCTTANCQIYALKRLDKKCVLICGWFDKWIDYSKYIDVYKQKVGFAVLFWDIWKKIKELFDKVWIENKYFWENFDDAVKFAIDIAKRKNIKNILFSPWASSFDLFANRKKRADRFVEIINNFR